ncbi:FxsA family membrane protein [Streptomyces avicenniae]|uniref:FxsA family membrane protein n=1 Tax=Streptomyces avicenniae TaxID=500153 RepID=UPI00069C09B9|nr:FxsA family membrane protein [Streptomyces avicenniae]
MTTGSPNPYRGGGRTPPPSPSPRRRRSRPLLPLAVAVWAVLEIWLLILVGRVAGGFTVFLLLAAGVVVGAVVIKQAGRRAWARLTESLRAPGQDVPPAPTTRGGNGLTMLGGLLLMIPGLLSDVVGLLCIVPPTASLLRRWGRRYLTRRGGQLGAAFQDARGVRDQMRIRRPDGKVVQGEVVQEDTPEGREKRDGQDDGPGR